MNDDEFIKELIQAIEKSGIGQLMPEEEFEAWWKKSEEYHESPEGRAKSELEGAVLTYYLDNVAKYKFTDEMGEISGFGGGYEKACRVMLDSGLQWLDAHPDADPKFQGMKGVYGILSDDNGDATRLSKAVTKNVNGATGAMHQATVMSCLWIKGNGWDAYVKEMSESEED